MRTELTHSVESKGIQTPCYVPSLCLPAEQQSTEHARDEQQTQEICRKRGRETGRDRSERQSKARSIPGCRSHSRNAYSEPAEFPGRDRDPNSVEKDTIKRVDAIVQLKECRTRRGCGRCNPQSAGELC